jgi:hypothetical protein
LLELRVEDISFSHVRTAAKGFTCTDTRRVGFYDVEINPSGADCGNAAGGKEFGQLI